MKLRCKPGDIAIVIRDFRGCEGNIGYFVTIGKAKETHPRYGRMWEVRPCASPLWWVVSRLPSGRLGTPRYSSDHHSLRHPDAWLKPVKPSPGGQRAPRAATTGKRAPRVVETHTSGGDAS